jgi:hypothetical protein
LHGGVDAAEGAAELDNGIGGGRQKDDGEQGQFPVYGKDHGKKKNDGLAKSPNCPIVISTNGRNLNSTNLLRRKISR